MPGNLEAANVSTLVLKTIATKNQKLITSFFHFYLSIQLLGLTKIVCLIRTILSLTLKHISKLKLN